MSLVFLKCPISGHFHLLNAFLIHRIASTLYNLLGLEKPCICLATRKTDLLPGLLSGIDTDVQKFLHKLSPEAVVQAGLLRQLCKRSC